MKGFLLTMLLGVGLATLATVAAAKALLPESVWEQPTPTPTRAERLARSSQRVATVTAEQDAAPFTEQEALDVVGARLGSSQQAQQLRQELRSRGRVSYHSPRHWTVRLDGASWTAHGPGRYAEPDNAAAERLESQATGQ